jgi:hypothetical protein
MTKGGLDLCSSGPLMQAVSGFSGVHTELMVSRADHTVAVGRGRPEPEQCFCRLGGSADKMEVIHRR